MHLAIRIKQICLAVLLFSGQIAIAHDKEVEALPFCEVNEIGVIAQTIVDAQRRYSHGPPKLTPIRYLLRVECLRNTGICEVVRLNVGNVEAGQPISVVDLVTLKEMRLMSAQGRVARIERAAGATGIRISPAVTITIDLDKKRIEYNSSGELGQSMGVGLCP